MRSSRRSTTSTSTRSNSGSTKTINSSTLAGQSVMSIGTYGKVKNKKLPSLLSSMGVRQVSIELADGSFANYSVGRSNFTLKKAASRPRGGEVVEIDSSDSNNLDWGAHSEMAGEVCQDVYIARSISEAFNSAGNSNLRSIALIY